MQPENSPSIIGIVTPVVQWGLIIFGWLVVSRDNDRREQRKEIRSMLNDISKLIIDIQDDAHSYYVSSPDSTSSFKELKIKEKIQRLERMIDIVGQQKAGFKKKKELISFRRLVTGRQFESKERTALPSEHRLHLEISASAKDLILSLESKFQTAYTLNKRFIFF